MDPLQLRLIVARYEKPDNSIAFFQLANTLIPYFLFWCLAIWSLKVSYFLTVFFTLAIAAILMRIFVLMHDCGHGAMFKSHPLNKIVGFILGVFCGMPQFVWSSRHAYHHSTNGNWEKYGGPLGTIPVEKYNELSNFQKLIFQYTRHWALSPLGGFIYLFLNPRFTWIKGSFQLAQHHIRSRFTGDTSPFQSPYWKSKEGYWHMTVNNIVLISICTFISFHFNPFAFFTIFLVSLSLAGAAGLLLFTAQHNFVDSYASGNEGWNYHRAAIEGTSYLVLPRYLNWLTADIGYHHVHHLSSKIPNYRLKACHDENAQLFSTVHRIYLKDLVRCTRAILWNKSEGKVVELPPPPKIWAHSPRQLLLSET